MLRNIYLEGEMGQRFVPHLQLDCSKVEEVLKCLDANFSDFRQYLVDKHEEGVGFNIDIAGNELEDHRELLMDVKQGDITITPVPAGSKSGPMKILAAVALTVATAGAAAAATWGVSGMTSMAANMSFGQFMAAGLWAAGQSTLGLMALGVATNLALTGITQIMTPDPATDADQEQSYLFNGAEQNIVEGDPVPVLYGRLRVPGQPVSFEIAGAKVIGDFNSPQNRFLGWAP